MAKEKDFLLTVFDIRRACVSMKAKSLAETKRKLELEAAGEKTEMLRSIVAFEGNVYYHEDPITCEEYIDKDCIPRNIAWDEGDKTIGVKPYPFGNCKCGFSIYEGMAYCPQCGRKLRWDFVKKRSKDAGRSKTKSIKPKESGISA